MNIGSQRHITDIKPEAISAQSESIISKQAGRQCLLHVVLDGVSMSNVHLTLRIDCEIPQITDSQCR